MDLIAHILFSILLFDFNSYVIIGAVLPDIPYVISYISRKGGLEKTFKQKNMLFIAGERFHSLLIAPSIIITLYIITLNNNFIYILAGLYSHLFLDVLVHKDDGPRFMYPILDHHYPRGILQWGDLNATVGIYLTLLVAFLIKYTF